MVLGMPTCIKMRTLGGLKKGKAGFNSVAWASLPVAKMHWQGCLRYVSGLCTV